MTHPYVMIGSKQHKINIIPDYLMKVKTRLAWTLDAKKPKENIISGDNVAQAYSYAIHPEVRVPIYALCNGSELSVFHISQIEPILHVKIQELEKNWKSVVDVLSPTTIFRYKPRPRNLYPDFGIHIYKAGFTNPDMDFYFYEMPIDHIGRVDDTTLSIMNNYVSDEREFAVSFDFSFDLLFELVEKLPESQKADVLDSLRKQPYRADLFPTYKSNIRARLGTLQKSGHEEFIPFIIQEFYDDSP